MRTAVAFWLCVTAGCGGDSSPRIDGVEPSRGLVDRETEVVVLGRDLDLELIESDDRVAPRLWSGEISGRPLPRVVWRSPDKIEAAIPPGLSIGAHQIVLRSASRELRLQDAFVAVAPVAPRLDTAAPARIPRDGGPVRLRGTGMHLGSRVELGGADVPVTWVDDQTLDIVAPPGSIGPVGVALHTPVGVATRADLLAYEDR